LLDLVKSSGKTLIMATHSLDSIALADRVYSIHDGRLTVETKGKYANGERFQPLMAATGDEGVEGGDPTYGTG
jgi:ABC-type multidrug transport system ATPase subunit